MNQNLNLLSLQKSLFDIPQEAKFLNFARSAGSLGMQAWLHLVWPRTWLKWAIVLKIILKTFYIHTEGGLNKSDDPCCTGKINKRGNKSRRSQSRSFYLRVLWFSHTHSLFLCQLTSMSSNNTILSLERQDENLVDLLSSLLHFFSFWLLWQHCWWWWQLVSPLEKLGRGSRVLFRGGGGLFVCNIGYLLFKLLYYTENDFDQLLILSI